MSAHEKRQRSTRLSKSPIAPPPRVAISGRPARTDHQGDGQSESTPDPGASVSEVEANSSRGQVEYGSSEIDDKNARIAYLEKDMVMMEEEFSKELDQLSQKLTNESEISAYWQQKHSSLNQQFLKTDTDLRMLRHEVATRDKQREERDRDVKTRISSLALDRDGLKDAYHLAKVELAHREEEIQQLRTQVKALKDFVSTNSRTDGQVTDEVFGEMMQKLGNGLQNWVIQNFRRAKIDHTGAKEGTRDQLLQLVPTYKSQIASAKIHLIQSVISRVLVTSIFESYFVGLPEDQSRELQKVEQYLKNITGDVSNVNQWRSTTLAVLRKGAIEELQGTTDAVIDSVVKRINDIMNDISDVEGSEGRDQSLKALINSSIDLSRLVRVQKAVFKMVMPVIEGHQIHTFDIKTMEDIGGEDEETLEGREICCVTFPGMVKEGDESGGHSQFRNVIAKARVLCSPD